MMQESSVERSIMKATKWYMIRSYKNLVPILFLLGGMGTVSPVHVHAGAFIFAGETNGINVITHPTGYTGTGGQVQLNVCIVPNTPNATDMEQSVRNAVATFNQLQPSTGNFRNDIIPFNDFDFESVLLHEMGHCLGLAHPNLATESGLQEPDRNYTKSTDGENNVFNIGIGNDNVRGSSDDLRDDDVNLHWFRTANNNPFTIAGIVDSTTYARDTANLPLGHSYATNADRTVGSNLLSTPNSEAVMQQGTFNSESQRTLEHDDVATLRLAMSGADETQGNADDYTINLNYAGITGDNCDINVAFNQTGFAVCQVGGAFINATHLRITSANMFFNSTFNWHFNDTMPCNENQTLTQNQWTMFSLPCRVGISTPSTVNDVLGDDLTGTYDTNWVVFERDAAAQVYNKLTLASVMTPGTGYWVITDQTGQTVDIQGQDNAVLDIALVTDAAGRQNMVGHTLNFNVDWANAQIIDGAEVLTLDQADPQDDLNPNGACQGANPLAMGCVVSRVMNKWNGSAYQTFNGQTPGMQGTVNSAESIWVKAFKAGAQLRIPFIASAAAGNEVISDATTGSNSLATVSDESINASQKNQLNTKAQKPAETDQYIRLIVESGDLRDPGNVLGFLPDSVNGVDKHDLIELDPFGETYLTVVFPHPNWGFNSGNYTSDFRSPTGNRRRATWKFEVLASDPGREVTLRWEGPEQLLKKSRLIDLATGEKIKVQPNGAYTFVIAGNRHKFKWRMRRPKH